MSRSSSATVAAELPIHLVVPDGGLLPLAASICYMASDPYAVRVAFGTDMSTAGDTAAVEWTFARQLLTDGVSRPVGEGDVRVLPAHVDGQQCVALSLTSPAGAAQFQIALPALVEFLTRTYAAVPSGCESDFVDLDAEIAMLLWSSNGE